MSFEHSVKRAWNKDILLSALVELTYRCNLACRICYNDVASRGTPLGKEQYFRFFEDLREMQVLNLILSGGEPLAHPQFLALGRKARQLGFVIRIKSNGHALRGRLARRIKEEVDPFIVELSLHGARSTTHDRQTGTPGSFHRLLINVRELKALGIRTKLNAVLTRWNEEEIEAMFRLADELGAPIRFDPEVTPRDDGDPSTLGMAASEGGLQRLLRLDRDRALKVGRPPAGEVSVETDKHCGAGASGIAVDPFGNVFPCVQWRRLVGNLHEQSIEEIWRTSPPLAEIRELNRKAQRLVGSRGTKGSLTGFCPGLAELLTGSPLRAYPGVEKRTELLETIREERTLSVSKG